jgi:hypothetical protein
MKRKKYRKGWGIENEQDRYTEIESESVSERKKEKKCARNHERIK